MERYFAGLGVGLKAPILPTVAFVTGRLGAIQFGHFNSVGVGYFGAGGSAPASSDFLVVSAGSDGTTTKLGLNFPVGILLQPDPRFAIELEVGYAAVIPLSGSIETLHYVPLGLEAVVSPVPALDVGLRLSLDGLVASSTSFSFSYLYDRALMLWIRIHAFAAQ